MSSQLNNHSITSLAKFFLVAFVVLFLISIPVAYMNPPDSYSSYSSYMDYDGYSGYTQSEMIIQESGWLTGLSALLSLVMVLSFFVVARWLYVAAKINHLSGAKGLRFSPGWAVGWYFIPIANLFMPYLSMRETYKASFGKEDWRAQRSSWYLPLWWATWLSRTTLSALFVVPHSHTEGLADLHSYGILYNVLLILNFYALFKIISIIADNQKDKTFQYQADS